MLRYVLLSAVICYSLGVPLTKPPRLDGRIVGGSSVNIEDYPYQISLLYYGVHICGGSIITDRFIVTAAHCTDGSFLFALSIRAGSSHVNSGGTTVQVGSVHQHPFYNQFTTDYDISILQLASELTFAAGIGKVGLPPPNREVVPRSVVIVTGWGSLTQGGDASPDLQVVEVPIVSQNDCNASYDGAITDRMICAGASSGGKDACQGDSGGPLVINGELIGIVSWGYGCARPEFPGVYSSVPSLRSFITLVADI